MSGLTIPGGPLVLASANAGKLREFSLLLAPFGLDVRPQSEFGVDPGPEDAPTFVENALSKARHVAHATGLPALADDSGLVVDALAGAPGVRSARFAGSHGDDAANNVLLLERLAGHGGRSARFCCVLALLRSADDPLPLIATGTWEGSIATTARGDHGFGYDPLFIPRGADRTAAELHPEEKAAVSHRGTAVRRLRELLSNAAEITANEAPLG